MRERVYLNLAVEINKHNSRFSARKLLEVRSEKIFFSKKKRSNIEKKFWQKEFEFWGGNPPPSPPPLIGEPVTKS